MAAQGRAWRSGTRCGPRTSLPGAQSPRLSGRGRSRRRRRLLLPSRLRTGSLTAGRRGPPPCSDKPAGSRDWSEGRGEGGEAGRQPQRSSATATVQRPLGQAAAASILTAQSGSR
ncbi:putative uncharacterized protein MED14OS [Capricornis sumatraensis]|uniref:putative uncharacterized protein MED14OS n=1 Tax=Capricornis sumatraensis TaxID=34865 RepID=UPI0036048EA2